MIRDNLVEKFNPIEAGEVNTRSENEIHQIDWGGVNGTTTDYNTAGIMRINGCLYYLLKDKLGSVSVVFDSKENRRETHFYSIPSMMRIYF